MFEPIPVIRDSSSNLPAVGDISQLFAEYYHYSNYDYCDIPKEDILPLQIQDVSL